MVKKEKKETGTGTVVEDRPETKKEEKVMKVNCEQVAEALFNRTKKSSVRKAWVMIDGKAVDKPAKHVTKDIVPIEWTGKPLKIGKDAVLKPGRLGDIEITAYEYLIIGRNKISSGGMEWSSSVVADMAAREGFKSSAEMFEWLEQYAGGLETEKPFHRYHFRWC